MVTATSTENTEDSTALAFMLAEPKQRTGHAPPIDSFTGEKTEVLLDDWLWWTEGECLLYSLQGTFVGRHYKNGV